MPSSVGIRQISEFLRGALQPSCEGFNHHGGGFWVLFNQGLDSFDVILCDHGWCARFDSAGSGLALSVAELAEEGSGEHQNAKHQIILEDFDRAFFQNIEAYARVTLAKDGRAGGVFFLCLHFAYQIGFFSFSKHA
ncbi:hypothetical protein Caka_2203 [Coraliomargarita akajimensis DSM 45221]|uniref:Uncharacterized protein n=1 Tax=Coraliomargarita akajimensis (strain DSM 45221 / IAM 15411 / JCM 23193 / KCTC 12865 / 04OKA010-24) TaxID=583355 RepID=D5EM60_CORAD|nr:hypothetical protein Caka_2203 [Coraliomargarita akajimensis DSM 45221]